MTRLRSSGSTLALLLCLWLLVPRMGLAAEELPASSTAGDSSPRAVLTPASSGLPGTSEPTPSWLDEDSQAPRPGRVRAPRGLRILAETGAGLLTGTGLGVAGYLAGNALCKAGIVGTQGGWFSCFDPEVVGGLVGAGLGVSLGVFSVGELTGGDGKLYGALLGMASGLVTGILLVPVLHSSSIPFALAVPSLLGSVVGYELTTRFPADASSRPRFQPVLAVSSQGALLGLGGAF